MDEIAKELQGLDAPGKIRFTISADNSEDNLRTHDAFKLFAKEECANNYTLALKILLESLQSDFKYEALWEEIKAVKDELAEIRTSKETKKEDKKEVF